MRNVFWIIFLSALICRTNILGHPAMAQVKGDSLWHAKYSSLADIKKRANFPLLLVSNHDQYHLVKSQLVWVVHDSLMFPKLPARQAACLYYKAKDGGEVVIIQVKALPNFPTRERYFPNDNLWQPIASGYFFVTIEPGTAMYAVRSQGIDCLILIKQPFAVAEEIAHSLKAVS